MIKTLFTLSFIALGYLANATESPFRKSPQHPARAQVKAALAKPAAMMRNSSHETLPDSMHLSSWENNAWQLEEVAGLRYDARGRMQHMHLYDQAGQASTQFAVVDYHYTPQGALRSYVFSALFAGMRREQFRLDFNYDRQGNKTSGVIQMPDSLGNMTAIFGDSIAYAYDQNNQITSASLYVLDFVNFTGWIPLQQISQIQWTANGSPKQFESAIWDDTNLSWTDHRNFMDVEWGFGWNGFDRLFGTMQFDVDFSLYEAVDFRFDEPTQYTAQILENGQWMYETLRSSEFDGNNRVITLRNAYFANGGWVNENLSQFSYNQHGIQSITEYLFDPNAANHLPFSRTTYGYHANGSMSFKENEIHDGSRWQPISATTYTYARNASGQVASQLVREYDLTTQLFQNYSLTEFFYRQPVAASSHEQKSTLALQAYPNPTQNNIHLRLPEGTADAEIRVRNMQGQLLQSQKYQADQGAITLSLQHLPNGLYLLEAIAGQEKGSLRVVKQ